jgi:hypothetical protein
VSATPLRGGLTQALGGNVSAQHLIEAHRTALKEAEASGLTTIQTSTLHSVFDDLEKQLTSAPTQLHPLELEKFRSDLAGSLAYQEHVHNWNLEGFKQIIALGQSTLKSIMLINGGAAVALLAFLGNLITRSGSSTNIVAFADSMGMFVIGVFLAAVAYATTYFGQLFYDGEKNWQQRTGFVFHIVTSLVGAASLAAFLWGAHSAYSGFIAFAP